MTERDKKNKSEQEIQDRVDKYGTNICPQCGGVLVRQGGCYICTSCGYEKCDI